MTYTEAKARLDAIRNLPICEIDKRQPMLVALLAEVVNHETDEGQITAEQGNYGLEKMPYWRTLAGRLDDLEFERLGNGHFSAAYSHPLLPGKVIKVGFKKEDAGAAYAAFCRMHQGREGIPTVYDIQRHAGCYTVVLDHLKELNDWADDEPEHIQHHYFAARAVIERGADSYDLYPISEEFIKTCESIREFFQGIASFDCHSGNMMKNSHGELVITDPVSFSCEELGSEGFLCDPDELIGEIEAMKAKEVIERCKARKAKRNPQGTWRRECKAHLKWRRNAFKRAERHEMVLAKMRWSARQERRDEPRARRFAGTKHFHNVWLQNLNVDFIKIQARLAAHVRMEDEMRIQWNKPLHVDTYLDRKLQG